MTAIGICVEWFITFIEVTLCHYFIHIFFTNQFQKKKQITNYICVASVITTGVILLNLVEITFSIATVLFFVVANAVGGCMLYKGKFVDFLVVIISFATGFSLFEWGILQFIAFVWSPEIVREMQAGFSLLRITIIVTSKIIDILVCLLIGKILKKVAVRMRKTKLILFGIVAAFLSMLYLIHISGVYSDLRLYPIQTFLTIVLIFSLCFVYLVYRLRLIQNEQTFIAQQNHLLQKNYDMAQAAYQENAELYHDMRNHFLIVQKYLADGKIVEAQNYLEKISGSKALQTTERWTGIEAVDYILGQKMSQAKQQQITVSVNIEYPKDCTIDPVDLCTILMNLFDNAIEACQKEPLTEKKDIEITIRRIHHFIIIRVSNSCTTNPNIQDGCLQTSKPDSRHHGWGLKSVQNVVEKYQGTMEYTWTDSYFAISIMLFY